MVLQEVPKAKCTPASDGFVGSYIPQVFLEMCWVPTIVTSEKLLKLLMLLKMVAGGIKNIG